MTRTASVCAIIPTYNRSAMLKECIASILSQTRPVQQIIVVNDGSTDNTQSVVQSFGPPVRLLTKQNGGKATALNFALTHCNTDYVWICDDDDIAAPDGLEHLVKALDANPSLGFVYGGFRIFSDTPTGRELTPATYWPRDTEPNPKINFLEEMFTFQYAMLVRRSLYQSLGAFREDLVRSQDYEMTLRMVRNTKTEFVPRAIFYQRKHEGTRGSNQDKFSAHVAQQKWLDYDQKIFTAIRRDYAPEEFTPTFARNWNKEDAERAALLERALIFAKRALWNEAIADLRRASLNTKIEPADEEITIAETVIRPHLPWKILAANKAWVAELKTIHHASTYGNQIILALCRPLIWQAHNALMDGNIHGCLSLLWLLQRIVGPSGFLKRIALTIGARKFPRQR